MTLEIRLQHMNFECIHSTYSSPFPSKSANSRPDISRNLMRLCEVVLFIHVWCLERHPFGSPDFTCGQLCACSRFLTSGTNCRLSLPSPSLWLFMTRELSAYAEVTWLHAAGSVPGHLPSTNRHRGRNAPGPHLLEWGWATVSMCSRKVLAGLCAACSPW